MNVNEVFMIKISLVSVVKSLVSIKKVVNSAAIEDRGHTCTTVENSILIKNLYNQSKSFQGEYLEENLNVEEACLRAHDLGVAKVHTTRCRKKQVLASIQQLR